MTRETYRKMTGYFLQDEKKVRRIILANRLLTGIVFVSYPLYLISLLLKRDTLLPQAVLVPAVSFVVVTLFRKIVNEPRPICVQIVVIMVVSTIVVMIVSGHVTQFVMRRGKRKGEQQ